MLSTSVSNKIYLSAYFTALSNARNNSNTSEISQILLAFVKSTKMVHSTNGHPTNAHDIVENMHENCHPAKFIQSWNTDSSSLLSEIDASESSDDDESDYIFLTM